MHEWLSHARKIVAAVHEERDRIDETHKDGIAEFEKREMIAHAIADLLKSEQEGGRIVLGVQVELDHDTFTHPTT